MLLVRARRRRRLVSPDLLRFEPAPVTHLPSDLKALPAFRDGVLVLGRGAVLLAMGGGRLRRGRRGADEFTPRAGPRHSADTGRLDARYYDADAILARGHPHHDVHAPGYVLILGAFDLVAGRTNAAAVTLNAIAYAAAALLAYALARALDLEPRRARIAALLALLLPGALPYVFWAMAETVLGALVLAALVLAARGEDRPGWAAAAGRALVLGLLGRPSSLLALPAMLALQRGRARRITLGAFLAALLLFSPPPPPPPPPRRPNSRV